MKAIDSKEWYDAMFAKVSEVLETLVLLDSAFVGYIQVPVAEQPITLSWTKTVVTVTIDKYKWQMPIGWFVDDECIEKIVAVPASVSQAGIVQPPPGQGTLGPSDVVAPVAVATAEQPRSGGQDEGGSSQGMLAERPKPIPGVKTVDEILAESGIEDDDISGDDPL